MVAIIGSCPFPLSKPSASTFCNHRSQLLQWKWTAHSWIRSGGASPLRVRCRNSAGSASEMQSLRTCRNCKTQFDPLLNNPQACRFHTAHFGGETKRKFESVYTGGSMDTPGSGQVFQYWHCCGSEDPSDPGCTSGPHFSYDD